MLFKFKLIEEIKANCAAQQARWWAKIHQNTADQLIVQQII